MTSAQRREIEKARKKLREAEAAARTGPEETEDEETTGAEGDDERDERANAAAREVDQELTERADADAETRDLDELQAKYGSIPVGSIDGWKRLPVKSAHERKAIAAHKRLRAAGRI